MVNISQESIKGQLPVLSDDWLERQSTYFQPDVSDEPLAYGGVAASTPNDYATTVRQASTEAAETINRKRSEELIKATSRGRVVGWFVAAKQVLFDKYKDDQLASDYVQQSTRGMIDPSYGRHSVRIKAQAAHRAVLPERTEFSFSKLTAPGRHEIKVGSHRAPNKLAVAAKAGLTAVRATVDWLKTPTPEKPGQFVPLYGLFDVSDKTGELPVVR